MKLFEYAAFYLPDDDDKKPSVIVPTKMVLAKDDKQAAMLAARDIPNEYIDMLEYVEIAVRPF
jgi:hypothetical protein